MKLVELKVKAGLRNDVDLERFGKGDLSVAKNIEIDDSGKVARRNQTQLVLPGVAHSLWNSGDICLVVLDGELGFFDGASHTPITSVGEDPLAYCRILDDVFWTNGRVNGVVRNGVNEPDGIQVPLGMGHTVIPGAMREGSYLVTMTHLRGDKESGAHIVRKIDLPANSGISLSMPLPIDTTVTKKRVYVSSWNGSVPMLVGEVPATDTVFELTELPASHTVPVRTLQMAPMPPGRVHGYFAGRRYVAENNYLWYSQPYEYELMDLSSNFIGFESPVRTFAPTSDGIFIGTEKETVFLAGTDPTQFVRKKVASYGTVLGTEREVPGIYIGDGEIGGMAQMWMSAQGVCMGLDGGQFKNLTGGRFTPPEGVSSGASLLKVRGGTPQLVTSLFD